MITGENIILRGLELTDTDEILQHFNDVELRRFLGLLTPIAKEEEEQWIRNTWENRQKGTEYVFGIELKDNPLLIGTCSLFSIHRINRSAELGIAIWNKQYWGKGYGTEAIRLLLGYGFNFLNLHSVFLIVNEDNPRAIKAYEKVGFKSTARHRDSLFQDGKFKDTLLMDILEDEFRNQHPLFYPLQLEEK
ncbi:MAG: GNAT family N-acetyltransferase [Candidatus Hermodarchaeia archaeon]|jgi:RimJ/RimL family protein N-acetyltransferase